MLFLLTCLVGNVFAGDITSSGPYTIVGNVVSAIISMITGTNGDCQLRICQNCTADGCRPNG